MTEGVEQEGLIEALRACGLLKAGEGAGLRPLTGGVSSDVFRVETGDGRTLVVKRSIPRLRVKEEWLAPVERAITELEKAAAPTEAAEVSARVAELRARLAEAAEGTGSAP